MWSGSERRPLVLLSPPGKVDLERALVSRMRDRRVLPLREADDGEGGHASFLP